MTPIILDTGEVIRAADPTIRQPYPSELSRLYRQGRATMAAALRMPVPAPYETDGRRHVARWFSGPLAAWRRVSGRP